MANASSQVPTTNHAPRSEAGAPTAPASAAPSPTPTNNTEGKVLPPASTADANAASNPQGNAKASANAANNPQDNARASANAANNSQGNARASANAANNSQGNVASSTSGTATATSSAVASPQINPALVPPPPAMKPLPSQDNAAVSNPKHKSKKFPSIAPAETPSPAATQQPTSAEESPIKRYTPSGGYYVECFLREVITNIRRNPMMSIASISTVMVLALILGLFTVAVANLDKLAQELANEMQIKVYMADTFPAEEAEAYRQHILKIEHVTDAIFTPKDEAFQRLRERLDSAISLDDLEKNPLPDAFQVPVDDPKNLDQVAHELSQITAVEKVDYGRDAAGKLLALNKIVRLVGLVILLLLFASTVLIVSNTIRLTVFARRKEIDIMQLVGAADWFIRWPFILEGVSQGFIGAALAAIAIDVGYRLVVPHFQRSIAFIPVIVPNELMPYVCIGLAVIGCLVGAIGSLISVNRYLNA